MSALKTMLTQYLTMFAGCLQYIASDAHGWGDIETGGIFYGLWSHAGRPVILLATPAGPGAVRERAHFAVDPDYVTWVNEYLQERFGIQYIGNWHSHHRLGLDCPSPGDHDQIHGLAGRYGIPRMVQIVVTYEERMPSGDRRPPFPCACQRALPDLATRESPRFPRRARLAAAPDASNSAMRMNSFIYPDAARGPCEHCAVKILAGTNPIRTALVGNDILAALGEPPLEEYPLEKIVYDEVGSLGGSDPSGQAVPPLLLQQLEALPGQITDRTEIYPDGDLLGLSLPLSDSCRLGVVYRANVLPLEIHSVRLLETEAKRSEDITAQVLREDRSIPLGVLWGLAQRIVDGRRGGPSGLMD